MFKINAEDNLCKNCNNSNYGLYCKSCGQKPHTHRINFHYILHELQHSLFHVDGGILYTLKELSIRPGHTLREFIDGKRVKHFKPITFVLILSILHAFLEHQLDKNPFIIEGLKGMVDAIRNDKNISEGKFLVINWLIEHYSYTALLLIPLFSFPSWLAFIKSGYNYFEHLTLNTFLFGQITFIFILTLPLSIIFPDYYSIDIWRLLFAIIFTFWSYFQFFNNIKKTSRILNTILTYALFIICTTFLSSILLIFMRL